MHILDDILWAFGERNMEKTQTLRQNHMVLCRVALLGPEKAPDSVQLGGWGDI